ncbi:MAG TPA: aldolase/citrate lyase family protein [Verrucomicrobiales bacterium]|nr:aldolase/citrate lyase family protein [Verrucomicrobiales bacterium]
MNDTSLKIGTWLSIGSPVIAELAALAGFDWVLFDLEHGCESEAALPNQLLALRGTSTRSIVRVGAPYPDLIARVLDWGADGIMVPHVESADVAEAIVSAATYPPRGRRGYSRTVRAYDYGLRLPEADPLIMVQIETVEGIRHVTKIAGVEGVKVLFVGPADLRFSLEHTPETSIDEYGQCLEKVVSAARSAGKASGILIREGAELKTHADLGFTYIAIDSDLAILRKAYQQIPRSIASS